MIFNMGGGGVVPKYNKDAEIITPGTEDIVIPLGTYLRGALTILGDTDLVPEKLPSDVNIFGVQGTRRDDEGSNVWTKNIGETKNCKVSVASLYLIGNTQTGLKLRLTGDTSIFTFDSLIGKTITLKYSYGTQTVKIESKTKVSYTGYSTGSVAATWDADALTYSFKIGTSSTPSIVTNNIDHTITEIDATLLSFVVDDDSNAYPNGDFHTDGYYYELLGQVSSANVMSLSDDALETVQSDYRDTVVQEVES